MKLEKEYFLTGKINEECGVFGLYDVQDSASLTYFGLHALQHRGQEACGIATSNGSDIQCVKNNGLITEVFNSDVIQGIEGIHAVGHVRYATAGGNGIENVQPLVVRSHQGHFCAVHNGQIVNAKELKIELEKEGSIFQCSSDSEILVHLIQRESGTMLEKIVKACNRLEGAFAFIVMVKDKLYAIRDKNGLRPLSIAKVDNGYCISSETCAFEIVNGKFIRDIEPGEIVMISPEGVESLYYTKQTQKKMCAMEYIYFARPDSVIDGINVHTARRLSGHMLAKHNKVEADIVIGVPDSSLSAAVGFSEESGIPYELGLIKNRYVGRTFIQPTQQLRERGVRMKLSAISNIVAGKRVIMVDDSIVRGTTSKRIVQLLKDAGATQVHVKVASPPIISPCFYGVDTSSYEELISSRLNLKELCSYIGADSLQFLEIGQVEEAFKTTNMCMSCFSGEYPTNLFSLGNTLRK